MDLICSVLLQIYPTELENIPEFEEFHDWLCTFELFRGKHTFEEVNDEARRVGRFKVSQNREKLE